MQFCFLLLLCLSYLASIAAFLPTKSAAVRYKSSNIQLKAFNPSLLVADGLDADTLNAMGDIQDLNEALDQAIDSSNIAVSVLTKLSMSPLIIAIPILAGLLVAVALGVGISKYANGPGDD